MDTTTKVANPMPANASPTVLGRSVVLRGELSASEDLLIEGEFEGTINLQDHCLTIGAKGQVKAEIHARHVVIHGSVNSVVDQLLAFRERIGDFGTLLYAGHDWADPHLGRRSMELMATEVIPQINKVLGAEAAE